MCRRASQQPPHEVVSRLLHPAISASKAPTLPPLAPDLDEQQCVPHYGVHAISLMCVT